MTKRVPLILRRSSAVTLCALASLFLAACGGGGEPGADGSRLASTVPFSDRSSSGNQTDGHSTNEPEQPPSDNDEAGNDEPNTDSTDNADSGNDQVADSAGPSNNDARSDEAEPSVSEPDSGSTVQEGDTPTDDSNDPLDPVDEATEELASKVDGPVTLEWYRPQYRENGDFIQDGEIGGYEVRYRQVGAQQTESVVLDGEWAVEYTLDDLERGNYEFSVAAYDTNGVYSDFVSISPLP